MTNYLYNQSRCLREYQAALPILKGLLSIEEYQADVPGDIALLLFLKGLLSIEEYQADVLGDITLLLLCWTKLSQPKFGFLSLKMFNHTRSNKEQTKNPIAKQCIVSIMNNHLELLDIMYGINIQHQQVKNLINLILGKYLAYTNNCSGVICQCSGTVSGTVVHILSLYKYKVISKINATIGNKIKTHQQNTFTIQIFNNIATILEIINFNPMAIMPDLAITFGLLKKVFNFIDFIPNLIRKLINLFNFKIAHNQSKQYPLLLQLINQNMCIGRKYAT